MDLLSAMATFLRVVDSGSLSKAATALHVTPAAVSRQLSTLEGELDAPLLVRTTRRVSMTEEGRRFYEHALRTVNDAEEARASVRSDKAHTGLVTVSMPTAIGLALLDVALSELIAKHPGLRVDLRLEDHPVDLVAEGVDIAIRAGLVPPDTTALVAQPIGVGERVVVAAPSYLKKRGQPGEPSDLTKHDALVHLHAGGNIGMWSLTSGNRSISIEVHGPLRTNALHPIKNAAIEGAGIALLPWFLVAEDVEARRLRVLDLGGFQPPSQQIYALVRGESRMRARVRVVIEHVRTTLQPRLGR